MQPCLTRLFEPLSSEVLINPRYMSGLACVASMASACIVGMECAA